jgi:hypothetical protein
MNRSVLAGFALLALTGCNWVQLTAAGKAVSLSSASAVTACTRVGRAHVQTLSKVTVVERGGEKLQEELLVLARNEAGDLGGNTIVPESVITEGQQTFGVYRCP